RAPADLGDWCKRLLHATAEDNTDNYEYDRTHRSLVKQQSHRMLGRSSRCRRRHVGWIAGEVGARIALVKVTIGEVQSSDRAAETAVVDLLYPEARCNRQARQVRADRGAIHPDRAGWQCGKTRLALAANLNGTNDGTIGENAADAGGA